MGAQAERVFPIFFVVWVLLGVFSSAFFYFNTNEALKRKVWPAFGVGVGLVFLGFAWLLGFPPHVFVIMGPAVALATYLNLRAVKFCSACGKTLFNQNPFSPAKFCSRCGAPLEGPDAG